MMLKLVLAFLVLYFLAVIHQSQGCFWGSGCSKRDCSLSSCSSWSSCSQPCGTGGTHTRYRRVTRAAKCGGSCWSLTQTRPCNRVCLNGGTPVHFGCSCKTGYTGKCCTGVDGGWSSWSVWTECSKTCQIGIQARTRKCKQPAPRHGGKSCQGAAKEQRKCNTQPCAVDGGWSDWSEWTTCSESCGGIQERSRNCTSPEPTFGGKPCEGEGRETHECENLCGDVFGRL